MGREFKLIYIRSVLSHQLESAKDELQKFKILFICKMNWQQNQQTFEKREHSVFHQKVTN